jgi:uncharacterized protein with PIN domain
MQRLSIVAICPQCNETALRRSHSASNFEKYRKRHTNKRIFRCHSCGWRGWLYENELRFPSISNVEIPQEDIDDVIAVPAAKLDEIQYIPPEQHETPHARTRISSHRLHPHQAAEEHVTEQKHHYENEARLLIDASIPLVPVGNGEDAGLKDERNFVSVSRPVGEDFHSHRRHRGSMCPKCKSQSLYRSHSRNLWEKVQKVFRQGKHLYRCHECNWRGWVKKG